MLLQGINTCRLCICILVLLLQACKMRSHNLMDFFSRHTSTYMRVVSYYNLCSIPNFVMIFFCQHLDSISLHAYFILVTGIVRVLRGVIGKCFMYAAKIIANWSTCGRKPGDYNSTIIFEIDVMKNSSPLNLKLTFFAMSKPK